MSQFSAGLPKHRTGSELYPCQYRSDSDRGPASHGMLIGRIQGIAVGTDLIILTELPNEYANGSGFVEICGGLPFFGDQFINPWVPAKQSRGM